MSAHATLAIEASGLEVPGRCSCAPAATRGASSTSCSAERRSREVVAHLGGGAETAHRNAPHTGVPSFAGCIACSMQLPIFNSARSRRSYSS
jgi:hypothetical protein